MQQRDHNLITQMIWGQTTHVGCGWTQFPLEANERMKYNKFYPQGEYENFFVCNYGVGRYQLMSFILFFKILSYI